MNKEELPMRSTKAFEFEEEALRLLRSIFPDIKERYIFPKMKYYEVDAILFRTTGNIVFEIKHGELSKTKVRDILRRMYQSVDAKALVIIANKIPRIVENTFEDSEVSIHMLSISMMSNFVERNKSRSLKEVEFEFLGLLDDNTVSLKRLSEFDRFNLYKQVLEKVPLKRLNNLFSYYKLQTSPNILKNKAKLIEYLESQIDQNSMQEIYNTFKNSGRFTTTLFKYDMDDKTAANLRTRINDLFNEDISNNRIISLNEAPNNEKLAFIYQKIGSYKIKNQIQTQQPRISEIQCKFHFDLGIFEIRSSNRSIPEILRFFDQEIQFKLIKFTKNETDQLINLSEKYVGLEYESSLPQFNTISMSTSNIDIRNNIPYYEAIKNNMKSVQSIDLIFNIIGSNVKVRIFPQKGKIRFISFVGEQEINYFWKNIILPVKTSD